MGKDLDIKQKSIVEKFEQDGDNHMMSDIRNLVSDDAFDLSDDEKVSIIQ